MANKKTLITITLILMLAAPTTAETTQLNHKEFLSFLSPIQELLNFQGGNKITGQFTGSGSGTESSPYQISTCSELQEMQDNLTANYKLVRDINCSNTKNWNSGKGFDPIGVPNFDGSPFKGSFNGRNHTIESLTIQRNGTTGVALFGGSESGTIRNFGLKNVNISGGFSTAGVVGQAGRDKSTEIENIYVTGSIKSNDNIVGGIVGLFAFGHVKNTYTTANITVSSSDTLEDEKIGGAVGTADFRFFGTIENNYAAGKVEVENPDINTTGGFIGEKKDTGTFNDNYYDTEATGQNDDGTGYDDAGTELTTSEMQGKTPKCQNTMDFDWGAEWIAIKGDYPRLKSLTDKNMSSCSNSPNTPSGLSPSDNSFVYSSVNLSGRVSDPDNSSLTVKLYINGSLRTSKSGVSNNSVVSFDPSISKNETYSWYLEVSDGSLTTSSDVLSFETSYLSAVSNGGAPNGGFWVQGSDLRWTNGSTEFFFNGSLESSSVSGTVGSVWVQGEGLHWISESGDERKYVGRELNQDVGPTGGLWVQNNYLHYIDGSGDERVFDGR